MPLSAGQVLKNRYRVVALLGQGGFGAVYRAWDMSLDGAVALKESLDTSPAAQRQFELEAKILFKLRHPNLPRVTDYFFAPGQGQYLVMDYIEGQDLDSLLSQTGGPLPETQVIFWITQVCQALDYLHTYNPPIIHRDIKPANIRITPQGRAILVDFGIAKTYNPNAKTTQGARAVTPGFSPPEQYGYGRTDPRSDVYALGATVYALLTGHAPVESVQRTVGDPLILPRDYNPTINTQVEKAILQAMALMPNHRFQTVNGLVNAFSEKSGQKAATVLARPPTSVIHKNVQGVNLPQPSQRGAMVWFFWLLFLLGVMSIVGIAFVSLSSDFSLMLSRRNMATPTEVIEITATFTPTETLSAPRPSSTPTSTPALVASNIFVEYILSSANSMMQPLGGDNKYNGARKLLVEHWQTLPANLNISLRVYGSNYPAADESQGCRDTQLLAPFGVGQLEVLFGYLSGLQARGMAPIWESLYATMGDFQSLTSTNAVVLIADSADTCGRDPCDLVRTQTLDAGMPLPIYVIGLNVDGEDRRQLQCIAETSHNGYYLSATDETTLAIALEQIAATLMGFFSSP